MNCGLDISFILLCLFPYTYGQYLVGKNVYHSHHDMTKELRHIVHMYPDRSHLYSIGASAEGRELWVISLASRNPRMHVPGRPEIAFVGNMHGDEAVGKELLLYLAVYLLEFYNYDPAVREIMDNSRVHILPSMNPDGFAASTEGTCDGPVGRGNARKIDLNRNFPDFWEFNDVEREPETLALIKWMENISFVLAANFHGGTLVANYPFDNNKDGLVQYSEAPDDDVLKHLALVYSKTHRKMYSGQACGDAMETFNDGITNGADWYPVTGSLQDYQYAFRGIMATTLEISCCKFPHADSLVEFWRENKEPMLEYLKQANIGVRGFITDANNGAGIRAALQIHGRRIKFFSSSNGEFYRILLPGTYIMKIQSVFDYYESKSVTFVVPKDKLLLKLNITLDYAFRNHYSRTSKQNSKHSRKTTKYLPIVTTPINDIIDSTSEMKTTERIVINFTGSTTSLKDNNVDSSSEVLTTSEFVSLKLETFSSTFTQTTPKEVSTTFEFIELETSSAATITVNPVTNLISVKDLTNDTNMNDGTNITTVSIVLELPQLSNSTEFAAFTSIKGAHFVSDDFTNEGWCIKGFVSQCKILTICGFVFIHAFLC